MDLTQDLTRKQKKKENFLPFSISKYLKKIFTVTCLPGTLSADPSIYWQQKDNSLGTQKGSNPLFSIYSHIIQDG